MRRQTNGAGNLQASPFDIGYVGGCLDCDGCITITRVQPRKRRPRGRFIPVIQFQNTNSEFIEGLHTIFDRYGVGHWIGWRPQRGLGQKPVGVLHIQGLKRVARFLSVFGICAKAKRKQLQLLAEYVDVRLRRPPKTPPDNYDVEMWIEIGRLNGRAPETIRGASC